MTAEERLSADPTSELWGEHRSRYRFAARFVAGKRVLDVASGAGFGVQMLRQAGARPIGVDYDAAAVVDVRCDATRLPLATGTLDTVVSFETIEHVLDPQALLREIRRVLKPAGTLVLSTPNRAFGPAERHTANPFHIQEFTAEELRDLLRASFTTVQLYGQRPSPVYRYVPYLMVDRHFEPTAVAWKLLARLPFGLKNDLALLLGGRPFYPGEDDYCFVPDDCASSHALIAVAS